MSTLEGGGIQYTVMDGDTLSTICANNPELGYSKWQDLRDANIDEISRVGRERMAGNGVGESVTRAPCGLKGHSGADSAKHFIEAGIHYDEPGAPTIYPGTVLFLKENKNKAAEEEEPPAEPEEEEAVEESEAETVSTNSMRAGAFSQCPIPRIELYKLQDDGSMGRYMVYDGEAADGYRQLLSYKFSEAVDDVKGSFSFAVENETDSNGKTAFDMIKLRSVVKIYEGGENPCFIGVIRRKNVSNMMSAQGPKKAIKFSGCSLIGLVSDFTFSLDIKIMGVPDPEIESRKLTTKLLEATNISDFMKITLDAYIGLTVRNFNMSDSETLHILKEMTNDGLDIFTHGGKDSPFEYNIANAFYSQGQNNIVDMWKNILPNPVYEIYGYCDKNGDMKIMAREAPFEAETWRLLRRVKIEPVSLKSYSLQQSDEEVYTVFNCWLEGSVMNHNFYTVVGQYNGAESSLAIDEDKLARYGYRPLEITFRGYDRSQNIKNDSGLSGKFKAINERAKRWYSRLDDMMSGTITIATNFAEPGRNPRIGERIAFLGGEFYLKGATHSWSYGGNPTIELSVLRGAVYKDGAMIEGEGGIINGVGREMRELENDNYI